MRKCAYKHFSLVLFCEGFLSPASLMQRNTRPQQTGALPLTFTPHSAYRAEHCHAVRLGAVLLGPVPCRHSSPGHGCLRVSPFRRPQARVPLCFVAACSLLCLWVSVYASNFMIPFLIFPPGTKKPVLERRGSLVSGKPCKRDIQRHATPPSLANNKLAPALKISEGEGLIARPRVVRRGCARHGELNGDCR